MKIVNDEKEQKSVLFEELEQGQCFTCELYGAKVHIIANLGDTELIKSVVPVPDEQDVSTRIENLGILMKVDDEQSAVDLLNGEFFSSLCGEKVFPVNAELHIIN